MPCKTAVHDFLGQSCQVRALCVACRQTEQDIEKIVEDKDSQNEKRSTKVAKELFADYVKEKKTDRT